MTSWYFRVVGAVALASVLGGCDGDAGEASSSDSEARVEAASDTTVLPFVTEAAARATADAFDARNAGWRAQAVGKLSGRVAAAHVPVAPPYTGPPPRYWDEDYILMAREFLGKNLDLVGVSAEQLDNAETIVFPGEFHSDVRFMADTKPPAGFEAFPSLSGKLSISVMITYTANVYSLRTFAGEGGTRWVPAAVNLPKVPRLPPNSPRILAPLAGFEEVERPVPTIFGQVEAGGVRLTLGYRIDVNHNDPVSHYDHPALFTIDGATGAVLERRDSDLYGDLLFPDAGVWPVE
jgi:hypothetical protein